MELEFGDEPVLQIYHRLDQTHLDLVGGLIQR